MRGKTIGLLVAVGLVAPVAAIEGRGAERAAAASPGASVGPAAAGRGRVAPSLRGFLRPEWSEAAYDLAGKLWDQPAPDPKRDPAGYAAAFRHRYGLHPAPYPNDGLPMGLRRGLGPGGTKTGLQMDCLLCHGGSIGGPRHVGPGENPPHLQALPHAPKLADRQP